MISVGPSVLAADYGNLARDVRRAQRAGADFFHIDIMDGNFVPNITIGPDVVRVIKKISKIPLHVHLMIAQPENFVEPFVKAGADILSFHIEAVSYDILRSRRVIAQIKKAGVRPALALNPTTSLQKIQPLLTLIDWVLIMTVNPGFGGQKFMENAVPKISKLRAIFEKDIEVDGGITDKTAPTVVRAGANCLAAGTFVFKADSMQHAIRSLKNVGKKK